MDPKHLFADERMVGFCAYCGGNPETADHCPSKVLLDEPFPSNLRVVDACNSCNNGFSKDELYLACIIECTICGSTEPNTLSRAVIKRALTESSALSAQLNSSRQTNEAGNVIWNADVTRVQNVVLKLARGHIAFELSLLQLDEPEYVGFIPFAAMSDKQRAEFESPPEQVNALLPEIGSRAFIRTVKGEPHSQSNGWVVVQSGRYRYLVTQSNGNFVQMVLSEYLACQVVWH